MRELFLQLKSLARFQNPFLNRGQQQLAREFPEAVGVKSHRQNDGRRPLWCFLAGRDRHLQRKSWYWEKRYRESVAVEYGILLSDFTRWIAATIDDIDIQHLEIEKELFTLVYDSQFQQYNLVFDQFNFGLSFRALLLSQVYPIEKFESMGAFKKRIGAAKDEYSSGDMNTLKKGGSKLCRTEFYLWVTTAIALKQKRPQSDVGQLIAGKYDDWVRQFENDPEVRQKLLASQTKEKALKSMRNIVTANLKPHIDGEELTTQLLVMETMFNGSWTNNVEVKSLNKNQVQRKFGKLIIGKTTGYAARWLYRLLISKLSNYLNSEANRELLVRFLTTVGFQTRTATNGTEAIKIWQQWQPHLIWMDMRMPVMDGYEATKIIKAYSQGNKTIIIALTATAFEEERGKILAVGCNDLVRKPFKESEIFDKMAEQLDITYLYETVT